MEEISKRRNLQLLVQVIDTEKAFKTPLALSETRHKLKRTLGGRKKQAFHLMEYLELRKEGENKKL